MARKYHLLFGALFVAVVIGMPACKHSISHEVPSELYTNMYYIEPDFLPEDEPDTNEPFPAPKDIRPIEQRLEEDADIMFPKGTMVTNMGLSMGGILLRNTERNHKKLVRYLDRIFPGRWCLYTDLPNWRKAHKSF